MNRRAASRSSICIFICLPCWTGVAIRPPGGPFQSAEKLKPYADKIIAALAGA